MASVLIRRKFGFRQTGRVKKAMYGWKQKVELCCPHQRSPGIASNHQGGASGKEPACQCRRLKRCRFDPRVRMTPWSTANHSSILAWRIPWTEEPDGLHTVRSVSKSWTRLKQLSTHTRARRYKRRRTLLKTLVEYGPADTLNLNFSPSEL